MNTFKRVITLILIVIVVALAGGMIYLNMLKTRAVPDYNAGADLEGLEHPVTVYRDSLGIPHIYAESETDLYRTVGYVMAQDRLWQMDLMRRITTGRLSEVLDPGLVHADQLFRALDFPSKSEFVLSRLDPGVIEILEAYADGINQYIKKHQNKLPFEFAMLGYKPEPWEPIHTVNLIGYMAWDLSSGWSTDMALYKLQQVLSEELFKELLPEMRHQDKPVFPEFMSTDRELELQSFIPDAIGAIDKLGLQVFEASNNWAVSGEKSETGLPILSNDMHLGLMSPGIWYQMHQVAEDGVHVTGVALPGAPFIICGHNENIAWGMTNVMVDDLDFYLETIHPADSNQYRLDGEWKDMTLKEEKISVKGMDEPVIRVNRYTHRGPVVSQFRGVEDRVITARWQGNEYSNELRTVHLLNRARNWGEFRDAVSTFNSISQNIIYADREGNIGLQTAAGIPIRRGEGILVYPGDTSLYDWLGSVPFEELPYVYNPDCGYVSSANNKTVDESYPYYIGSWFSLPHRIGRIREMLEEKEVFGTADFKRMLRDQNSHFARDYVPLYLEALDGHTDSIYDDALQELKNWDYQMKTASSAALITEFLWLELNYSLFHDELGDSFYPLLLQNHIIAENLVNKIRITAYSPWCDNIDTPDIKETFDDNIKSAFFRTVDTLSSMYGPDPTIWQWGDLHKISLLHPMGSVAIVDRLFKVNRGPYPVGGSSHTVCPYYYTRGQSFISKFGASQRHIFHTADWDRSLTVIPTGTSGVPASPHYMDQTEMYINNRYHSDFFSRSEVEKSSLYKAIFD